MTITRCCMFKWNTLQFHYGLSTAYRWGLMVGSKTANLQRTTISSHMLAQAWAATSDWPLLRPVCPLALLWDADVLTLYHQPVICRERIHVRCPDVHSSHPLTGQTFCLFKKLKLKSIRNSIPSCRMFSPRPRFPLSDYLSGLRDVLPSCQAPPTAPPVK